MKSFGWSLNRYCTVLFHHWWSFQIHFHRCWSFSCSGYADQSAT